MPWPQEASVFTRKIVKSVRKIFIITKISMKVGQIFPILRTIESEI